MEPKPTQLCDSPWIFEEQLNKYQRSHGGKWMLFYDNSILDDRWQKVKKLYRSDQLVGISSMKVSTAFNNPRASDNTCGVVICYCGPDNDEEKVLEYGRNLVAKTGCHLESRAKLNQYIYYKSDNQTALGTRATGMKKNWLYRIFLPSFSDAECSNSSTTRASDLLLGACSSGEHRVGGGDTSSTSSLQSRGNEWKVGDKCVALYHEDHHYYPAVIEGIINIKKLSGKERKTVRVKYDGKTK